MAKAKPRRSQRKRTPHNHLEMPTATPGDVDTLVPDPQVCREFGITSMSLWRWDEDEELDFPPRISIRKRNFRSRRLLEQFKARMLAKAISARGDV